MNINYFDFERTSLEHLAKRLPNECGLRKVMGRATAARRVKGTRDRTCAHIIIYGFVQFSNFRSTSQFIGHLITHTMPIGSGYAYKVHLCLPRTSPNGRSASPLFIFCAFPSFSLIKTNNLKIHTKCADLLHSIHLNHGRWTTVCAVRDWLMAGMWMWCRVSPRGD